eukprot:scaffold83276_cov56-Phaeocystis_antarctica.AAC.1
MIFSFLIASVSTEPHKTGPGPSPSAIGNHCKEDGVVPNSYMVKLNPQNSELSAGHNEPPLSFLQGWVQKYNPAENTPNAVKSTRAVHFFMQTQLAVAVETGDDVRHAQHTRPCRASGPPRRAYAHGPTPHRTRSPCAWPTTRPSPRLSMTATAARTRTSRCSRTTTPRRARMARRTCTRWAAS